MASPNFAFPDPIKAAGVVPLGKTSPAKPAEKAAIKAPVQAPADSVEISPEAQILRSLASKLKGVSDARPDHVEEIRSKLSNIANSAALNAKLAEKLLTEN